MCVWEKRGGNDVLFYIYLPIDFFVFFLYIFSKEFCFDYMFQCGESQGIRQLCPEYLSSIAGRQCEFDLFKTAGKISIFLRHAYEPPIGR